MKMVKAYIKPLKLPEVTLALHGVDGLSGMSVTDARGFGRGWGRDTNAPREDRPGDFKPIVKIEVFCAEELLDEIVSTIEQTAHTGLQGDGKIYVVDVLQAVRISTGERGEKVA